MEGGKREAGTYIIQLILQLGPVILKKIMKIALLNVVWDWRKVNKLVLEKSFFFSLWCFYLFLVLVSKNFKNGPSEKIIFSLKYVILAMKNQELCADFKNANLP
jgi:hypothetical protein